MTTDTQVRTIDADSTSEVDRMDRVRARTQGLLTDLRGPASASDAPARVPRRDLPILRLLTVAWALINTINFTIWAVICVAGLHWESPWWLWTLAPPGALLALVWWYTNPKRSRLRVRK